MAAAPIRFEGRWIDPEQMDIWQCCDEVELDAMREHDIDDETDDEQGSRSD